MFRKSIAIFFTLSVTSGSGINRQAQWEQIGGINYDFNPAPLTQPDAKKECIANGGRLFEPKSAKINRDVFIRAGAKLGGATNLWIGISDIGTEDDFRYISDEKAVQWKCEGSSTTVNAIGCWRQSQPIIQTASTSTTEIASGDLEGQVPAATQNLDCVFGRADRDGKWATSNCNTNVAGLPISTAADTALAAPEETGIYTFTASPARFGSICEQAVAPSTTTQPPESTSTTKTSDSTCLKTGITLMIGMLFFCYQ